MQKGRTRKPAKDRFQAMVEYGDGCWEWRGAKTRKGYGQFCANLPGQFHVQAHRFAYQLTNGRIPCGMCVLHRCDNPGCVRPDHLYTGTQADNLQDMVMKGRARYGGGHGRGVGRSLNRETAYAILWREAAGEPHRKLAVEYGVIRQTIGDIANRRRWLSLSQSHD